MSMSVQGMTVLIDQEQTSGLDLHHFMVGTRVMCIVIMDIWLILRW